MKLLVKSLMGRLGNLLFDYVVGMYVAQQQNRKLVFKNKEVQSDYLQFFMNKNKDKNVYYHHPWFIQFAKVVKTNIIPNDN